MRTRILNYIERSVRNYNNILLDGDLQKNVELLVKKSIEVFRAENKILLCGNGGSAADAQHISSELSGKFYKERPPLYAEALHVNSSFITAVANDFGYEKIYERMIEASGKKGDILIALSTSGKSNNIINALIKARELEMFTVGFTGNDGGEMHSFCDLMINIPEEDTPRIQEGHILIGHILCQLIEEEIFS